MVYNDRTMPRPAVNNDYQLGQGPVIHADETLPGRPAQLGDTKFIWRLAGICGRAVAFVLMLLGFPCFLAISLITFILSRDSPLVAHERIGLHGKPLWVLKLRTMWPRRPRQTRAFKLLTYLPPDPVPERKLMYDPRITSTFAAFCRRYSIDEWPQLWQVVKGELALVGPRPLTLKELERYYGPLGAEILRVKPGLTGLWQVNGRSGLSYGQRRELDLQLVRSKSLLLRVKIIALTLPRVLTGKNAG